MSTSLRNKHFKFIALVGLILGISRFASANPIANITVTFIPSTATFVAGTPSTSTVFIVTTSSGGSNVDADTLTLQLLDGTDVISNGISGTVTISSGNSGGYRPAITLFRAGSNIHIKATSSASAATGDSEDFAALRTVSAGAASKLVVLGPGETLAPGTNPAVSGATGKTGSNSTQVVSSTFGVTVMLTDNQFNSVSGTNLVSLTGGSYSSISPASQNLSGGQATFVVSITAPKVTETYTATATGLTSGSTSITSGGPASESIAAFPSPFNPHTQTVKFQFVVDTQKDMTVKVVDQFGQEVWEKTTTGLPNTLNIVTWDGKNDRGIVTAAGIYYVLLEDGGSLKSKKKFGVIK